jgi:hypothetical protein
MKNTTYMWLRTVYKRSVRACAIVGAGQDPGLKLSLQCRQVYTHYKNERDIKSTLKGHPEVTER